MKKLRILIADDDTMVRLGLKSIIGSREESFTLVGEAQNGAQALALAKEKLPDVVITDIKMPGMDGIALIQELRNFTPSPVVLVLSSYDEFELVKQALKLGAKDYLLKLNLDPQELLRSLYAISEQSVPDQQAAPPAARDEKHRSLLRRNFLWDVISNYYLSETHLKRSMTELDIHLDGRPIYCMMIKAGELYRFEEASAEELQTLQLSVIHITEEIICDVFCGYCFSGRTGEFVVLFSGEATQKTEQLKKLGQRLRRMLLEYLNLSCTIFIASSVKSGSAGIKEAYLRTNELLGQRFYLDGDGVLFWNDQAPVIHQDAYSMSGIRAQITDTLITGSPEEIRTILRRLGSDITRLQLSRATVCRIALELFNIIQEYFERNELPVRTHLPNSCRTYEQLLHMETMRDVLDWMTLLSVDLASFMRRENEKGYPQMIRQILDWIAAHYPETASVQEAAHAVSLNPSYMSTLLKKYTGKNYTELLTEYRIERAKELLLLTNRKIYQVGQLVGYADKYYFSRIFKRVTGMSPNEFKNQNREAEHET